MAEECTTVPKSASSPAAYIIFHPGAANPVRIVAFNAEDEQRLRPWAKLLDGIGSPSTCSQ